MSRRALERSAPMTSSTSLRLPQKTSGLFDTGYAGGALNATSLDLNAHTVLASDQNPFADALGDLFEADAFTDSGSFPYVADDTLGLKKVTAQLNEPASIVQKQQPELVSPLIEEWEALAGLGTNQLNEDSLDAFINLDGFLSGNALLDDGNNIGNTENTTNTQLEPEVAELNPEFLNFDFLELAPYPAPVEVTPEITQDVSSTTTTTGCTIKTKRALKRKAKKSSGPVKTSMFEIDAAPAATSNLKAAQSLDHDYTAKRQKIRKASVTNLTNDETAGVSNIWDVDLLLPDDTESSVTSTSSAPVDKQAVRRMKNNVASKRSREQRKQKFVDMDQEAEELIEANAKLREKIVELEKMAMEMKAVLVAKMAGPK